MDKLKEIKIKQPDGSYSSNIPIGVNAENVDLKNGKDLETSVVFIDTIVDNFRSTSKDKPLSANAGKILNEQKADKTEIPIATEARDRAETAAKNAEKFEKKASASASQALSSEQKAVSAADKAASAVIHGPKIENKTWWVWNFETETYIDTGIKAFEEGVVKNINNKIADSVGKVTLTATDVGAATQSAGVRENLLDNWYFDNPINQRKQTEYVGTGYGIDCWWANSQACKVLIEANGIHMTYNIAGTSTATQLFIQKKKNFKTFAGKTLTFSALVKGNCRVGFTPHAEGLPDYQTYSEYTLITATEKLPDSLSELEVFIQGPNRSDWWCKACKLEVGEGQTLAHLEHGQWILNEVPNYDEELRKARRYYRPLNPSTYLVTYPAFVSGGGKDILISLDDEMADIPDILGTAKIVIRTSTGYCPDATYEIPAEPVVSSRSERVICLKKGDSTPWAKIVNNTPIMVTINDGSSLALSSEV